MRVQKRKGKFLDTHMIILDLHKIHNSVKKLVSAKKTAHFRSLHLNYVYKHL